MMGTFVPDIDGSMCVHALAPSASCTACVDACPAAALILDDEGLSLDPSLCEGCGLCVPACPRAAITLSRPVTRIFDERGEGTAWAACVFSAVAGEVALGCLHALGTRDLDQLADEKIRTLHIVSGDCRECPRSNGTQDIGRALKAHDQLRHSHQRPAIQIMRQDLQAFGRSMAQARSAEPVIDRGRRGLFTAFLAAAANPAPSSEDTALAYHAPRIDTQRCIACDACIQICPDGALHRVAGSPSAYTLSPDACTGCGLCVDVCDQKAITVQQMAPAQQTHITLDSGRCTACGAPYDWIAGASGKGGNVCRICAAAPHHKKLFQVIGAP